MRPRPGDLVTYRGPGFVSLRGSVGLVLDTVAPPALMCLVFVAGRHMAFLDEELEVRARGSKEN